MASTRCVIMPAGTSKAVFLKEADLPLDETARDQVILRIFGSPDKRQVGDYVVPGVRGTGVIETEADVRLQGNDFKVQRATLGRTARRIMEGYVFTPDHAEILDTH